MLGDARRFRHLPPTAVPVAAADLWCGLSGVLGRQGTLDRFRAKLQECTDSQHCYLVSSGRAALTLILLGLKQLSHRRKVVVPAYTCPTVVQAVLRAGLAPVFCDVCPQTLHFSDQAVAQLIGRDVLAVIPVHLYGWAQDVRRLLALGREYGFFVVEDAAQAFGACVGGRMVGSWGDAGFYSLGRGKCLPVGHGGVVISQEACGPAIAEAAQELIPGSTRLGVDALPLLLGYGLMTQPTGWWFVVHSSLNPAENGLDVEDLPPIDVRGLTFAEAGIGLSMLERLGQNQAVRQRNARRLMAGLAGFDFAAVPEIAPGAEPAFLRLPVVVQDQKRAGKLFDLLSQQGIGVSRSYQRTAPDLFSGVITADGQGYPGASRLATCLLTLPTHGYVTDEDFGRIFRAFQAADSWERDCDARTAA